MSASGSQRPLVIGTRAPRTVRSQSVAASRIADRSVRTPRPRPIESTYCRRRALIRQIAAAEAAEIVSLVWACLVFPGFPSWNTSRLNRNLGIRNDRVSDARASFGYRALLFRIRGSILDVDITTIINKIADKVPEQRVVSDTYSILCEVAHPNWVGRSIYATETTPSVVAGHELRTISSQYGPTATIIVRESVTALSWCTGTYRLA